MKANKLIEEVCNGKDPKVLVEDNESTTIA